MKVYECSSCRNKVAAITDLTIICKCGNRMYEKPEIIYSRYLRVKKTPKGARR